jgi:hypothetical protein
MATERNTAQKSLWGGELVSTHSKNFRECPLVVSIFPSATTASSPIHVESSLWQYDKCDRINKVRPTQSNVGAQGALGVISS